MTKFVDKGKYYLGVNNLNEDVYLEKPSWDCDWYWGFGYITSYSSLTHWDYIVQEAHCNAFDAIKKYFKTLAISDDALWKLCDYMQSYYTLRSAADLFYSGNSNYTSDVKVSFKDKSFYEKINEELLPNLFKAIDDLFKGEKK